MISRPALELADVFRRHGPDYRLRQPVPVSHLRVMRAIEVCRTATLGGHVEQCHRCAFQRIAYNSCRNRHCPKCQTADKLQWLRQRNQELLPIPYFHVVFTLPEQIAAIARDPKHLGAEIGFFPSCIPGGRTCCFTPMCTASSPAAVYRPTGNAGCPAARISSSVIASFRAFSAACFSLR